MNHTLYILAHPSEGVVFALGRTANEAWANACMICHATDDEESVDAFKTQRRAKGWRARLIKFET